MRQIILLADDSPTIQRLVTQTFADTRFDIVTVNNGDAAIRKLEEVRPDLVLADIYMPGKNGFEVCAYIKAHQTLSGVPVILLVGAFDAFDEATGSRAGAVNHITKPFEPRALVELVKSVLEGTSRSDEPRIKKRPEEGTPPPPPPKAPVAEIPISKVSEAPSDNNDLLGLEELFHPAVVTIPADVSGQLSEEEVDKIADRVIHKLSTQVIENIAWEVVPDITIKILRDELKRSTHEG